MDENDKATEAADQALVAADEAVQAAEAEGTGEAQVPEVLQHLPELARSVLSYGVATGGLTAILLNLLLPRRAAAQA